MYHYTECGLDSIWLENGYTKRKAKDGEILVSFTDIKGLHKTIGLGIINAPRPMTGAEVRFLRRELNWSQGVLAGVLGVDEQTVARWEKEQVEKTPGPADRLLRVLYLSYAEKKDQGVCHLVDRLAALDRQEACEKIVLEMSPQHDWQIKKAA